MKSSSSTASQPERHWLAREQDVRALDMYQAYLRGRNMAEVGQLYGLSRERVRQLFHWNRLPRRKRGWRPPDERAT